MSMNAIVAKLELAKLLEEASHSELTPTRASQTEAVALDDKTEISAFTATESNAPKRPKKEYNPYFDIEQIRLNQEQTVQINDLLRGSRLPKYEDPAGRRAAARYKAGLTMVICRGNESFQTSTKDISLGGALLRDKLPKNFLQNEFDILIRLESKPAHKNQEYFMLRGQAVDQDRIRIRFTSASRLAQVMLLGLIEKLGRRQAA